jgi:hypothetical protein
MDGRIVSLVAAEEWQEVVLLEMVVEVVLEVVHLPCPLLLFLQC